LEVLKDLQKDASKDLEKYQEAGETPLRTDLKSLIDEVANLPSVSWKKEITPAHEKDLVKQKMKEALAVESKEQRDKDRVDFQGHWRNLKAAHRKWEKYLNRWATPMTPLPTTSEEYAQACNLLAVATMESMMATAIHYQQPHKKKETLDSFQGKLGVMKIKEADILKQVVDLVAEELESVSLLALVAPPDTPETAKKEEKEKASETVEEGTGAEPDQKRRRKVRPSGSSEPPVLKLSADNIEQMQAQAARAILEQKASAGGELPGASGGPGTNAKNSAAKSKVGGASTARRSAASRKQPGEGKKTPGKA
jgi:hypothetical protein